MSRLALNIGLVEADQAVRAVRTAGHTLVDIATPDQPYPAVQAALHAKAYDGVVILGGYDVLPSARMDVLPAPARAALTPTDIANDADQFVVWSDQLYGDVDGDQIAELPISRIPDGHSAAIVHAALRAGNPAAGKPFGIWNVKRPYGQTVFNLVPKASGPVFVSEPQLAHAFTPTRVSGSAYYLMLHGSWSDPSKFWGESATIGGKFVEAFNLANVPEFSDGIVFTGCCWGALTVTTPALHYRPGTPIQPFGNQSLALTFLAAGVDAFIGCTGSHYSVLPPETAPGYYGGAMHAAFWSAVARGLRPAEALFEAKRTFAMAIPHGLPGPISMAIELKTLRQFTCLGLGW